MCNVYKDSRSILCQFKESYIVLASFQQDKGIHVILGMFSLNSVARQMICEVSHKENTFSKFQLFTFKLNSGCDPIYYKIL